MTRPFIHPAVPFLLKLQVQARWFRIRHGFATPKRMLLSSLGIILAAIYIGQAVVSIALREPMSPTRLRIIIPMALLAYFLWDVINVAWKRPKQGVRLNPVERMQLLTAPLRRHDLLAYRFGAILAASVVKALVFCLVMTADLPLWPVSFLGALLALTFVDLLRLGISTLTEGMTESGFRRFRAAVFAIAGVAGVSAATVAVCLPQPLPNHAFTASLQLVTRTFSSFAVLSETWPGIIAKSPFALFAQAITASEISGGVIMSLLSSVVLVVATVAGVVLLDRWVVHRVRYHSRQQFRLQRQQAAAGRPAATFQEKRARRQRQASLDLGNGRRWGALTWRQLES
ncbi:MAG: hypothetical protein KDA60_16775, partial [Planctomycetales bacterium]|nr:hypothetical protein [Planctomycetales bacterium]